MIRSITSPLVRAAVVVVVLAVVLCLVVPTMGGGDHGVQFALACCFVLAGAVSVFLLRGPAQSLVVANAFGHPVPLARGPNQAARPPDIVALSALLI